MAIPFRDDGGVEELGAAGLLVFLPDADGAAVVGGLLVVDARAEPLEFAHHWMALPAADALWSPAESRCHAERCVAVGLFRALGCTPGFLLSLGDGSESGRAWYQDLEIGIPVGVIRGERFLGPESVRWLEEPGKASPAGGLYERLTTRALLAGAFERASSALAQLYPGARGSDD